MVWEDQEGEEMKKCAYYKSEEQAILKCPNRECQACHWYREQTELNIKKEENKATPANAFKRPLGLKTSS